MKTILITMFMYLAPFTLLQAKTIKEADGTEYTCTRVKSCDEKLKAAYAQIAELKRKRQQIKEVIVVQEVQQKQRKNSLILEGRRDHTGLKTEVNGNVAKTISKKNLVLGLDYYRRELLDSPVGAGIGIDMNAVLKLMVGLDF